MASKTTARAKPSKYAHKQGVVYELPLSDLQPDPHQPRQEYSKDGLASLAGSIAAVGVIQPITFRVDGSKLYIVSGERRWRASKLAKAKTIKAILATDEQSEGVGRAAAQLAENLERESLNAMDVAAFLSDLQKREGKSTNELIGALGKLGITEVSHARVEKLLEFTTLPDWTQKMLRAGELTETHAVHLLQAVPFDGVMKSIKGNIENRIKWSGSVTVKDMQGYVQNGYQDAGIDLNTTYGNRQRAFSIDACKGCEFKKVISKTTYCLNPAEFDKKNKQALDMKAEQDAAAEERRRTKSKGEDRENPDPSKVTPRKLKTTRATAGDIVITKGLGHGTYQRLSDAKFDPATSTPSCAGCVHNRLASHDGEPNDAEPTCFHLPCFEQKQRLGKTDARRENNVESYLDTYLRDLLLRTAPARLERNKARATLWWLAAGALDRVSNYGWTNQKHELAANKTRSFLTQFKIVDFHQLLTAVDTADPAGTEQMEHSLVRCAIATMSAEQLRWFAHWLAYDLVAEKFVIDMGYLNLQRRDGLLKLAQIGQLEHARGSVVELKQRILNSPGSVDKIGAPADVLKVWNKPYQWELDPATELDEDYGDDQDEQLAAALAGGLANAPDVPLTEETICIGCGCTHLEPCNPPCAWVAQEGDRGVCSAPQCAKYQKRWAKGERKLSKAAASAARMRAEMMGVDA